MSQFFIASRAGPSPPTVATSYPTDVGTAIPAANVLNVNGGETTVNNLNGIETKANPNLSNNLQILLTNRATGQATTTTGATTTVITFPLGSTPGTFVFDAVATGFNGSTPAGCAYFLVAGARTTGSAATVIGSNFTTIIEDAALATADFIATASGNNILFQVVGVNPLTIDWTVKFEYYMVT